jgi:hypothetical protein
MPAFPIRYSYVDVNGEPVENYTEEDLKEGKVNEIIDIHNTFSPKNAVMAYCGNITKTMLEAMRTRYEIHLREIKKGNAKSASELLAEIEKRSKLEEIK